MTKFRITTEVLAAGQPRAYADTRTHVRVTWECTGWTEATKDVWKPRAITEEQARVVLPYLSCGFPLHPDAPKEWHDTKLQWLREISVGVWEFYTTSAYTG